MMDMSFMSGMSPLSILAVFGGAVVVILTLAFCARKGLLSFSGKGLHVGVAEKEQATIRNQWDYAKSRVEGFLNQLPPQFKDWQGMYVTSKVKDIFEYMIVYNHINTSDAYVKVKQQVIYDKVLKYTTDGYFRTDKFRKMLDEFTLDVITNLIKIRRGYDSKEV